MERRHGECHVKSLVELFKLNASEGHLNSCAKLKNNIINLSDYRLSDIEVDLLNRGLSFVPTPNIHKGSIVNAAVDLGRRLKIKYFFRGFRGNYTKNKKTFTLKSKWIPTDKVIDPNLLNCISDFTSEVDKLDLLREKENLSPSELSALRGIREHKNLVFKKADKGSATVIMDKQHYLTEGYRQLTNSHYYKKLNAPLFHQTSIKVAEILNKLRKAGVIVEKQLQYLLPPVNPRPRRFYMLPKIHKAADSWTLPNKMPPGRPIVSDCNSESKNVAGFIDSFLKPPAMKHPSFIKNTYDFVNKISNLTIPDNCLLITLDVESMYTNIDHDKGLTAVSEAVGLRGPLYDGIMQLLELSLKNNDFMFNGEWYLQTIGTSMGRDWAPHYADIYMAKFEKEALHKSPLKPHTYYRYLDDIFIVWPHGEDAFITFLESLNQHEPPIKFKASINKERINYLDTTIFKNPGNKNELLTKVFFKPTDTHQLLHKTSFHPKHTFQGIIKSQITRFFRICSNESDFDEACNILFKKLTKRNYSRRWLRSLKSKTFRALQIRQRQTDPANPTHSQWGSKQCGFSRCKTCKMICSCQNITSTVTQKTYGIIGKLDCNSSNIIYAYECLYCEKQYVGESGTEIRVRNNGHRYAVNSKCISSSLFTHIQEHIQENEDLPQPSIEDFNLIPLEQIPITGSYAQDKLNRLKRETFWIDTLGTLNPGGLNKKRYEEIFEQNKIDEIVPFIIPFSKTANLASRIIKKHFRTLQEKALDYDYRIITAYSKHKNLASSLVSSKM